MVHEVEGFVDRDRLGRRGHRRRHLVHRGLHTGALLTIKAIERLIAQWGLAWTFRFLGAMSLVVGGVGFRSDTS